MDERDEDIVKRLRRIEGQVSGIRKMHEDGRYCVDVLDQISAARAGLGAVALVIVEDHIDGCLRSPIDKEERDEKARELVDAIRRFVKSA